MQGRGELRRELARCLRSGRAKRRPHGFVQKRGKIPDMVMISERPAEVEDRAVPGHWEGDLIVGTKNQSAVGTLVERSTRLVLLLHLGKDHTAPAVEAAMRKAIATLPSELMRSITWDSPRIGDVESSFIHRGDRRADLLLRSPLAPWQRGRTRTPMAYFASRCPKGPTSLNTPQKTS